MEIDPQIMMHQQQIGLLETKIEKLMEENASMRAAIQEFVDRVERGEIRSVKTYAKFVELLRPKE